MIGYTAGRAWIELLRIDPVQANDVLGLRLNVWTSAFVLLAAVIFFAVSARLRPGREEQVMWKTNGSLLRSTLNTLILRALGNLPKY